MRALLACLALTACLPLASAPEPDAGCVPGLRRFVGLVDNARDLGGTPLTSGAVRCGALVRGAVPSADGVCGAFAAFGMKTVIDLRVANERLGVPDAPCLSTQSRMVTAPMPIPYDVSPADYLADLDATASVRTVFTELGKVEAWPVFFHCTWGRDRSGVVAALILSALGASREEILRDYARTNEAGLVTTPASLEAVLDEVERRGGVEAHLQTIGVSSPELATLRAQAQ